MLYAAFKDSEGRTQNNLYLSAELFHRDTFNPDTEIITIIEFKTSGKTYEERRESVRSIAADFQAAQLPGLSWAEISIITSWFYKMGRRFGLVSEFRENCII